MSRKQIFANLGTPAAAGPASGGASGTGPADPPRASFNRVRPILGSPDLIQDTSRSPVGAISQSLSEVSERNKRAEEIERRLAEGQVVIMLDPGEIDPSFIPDRMPGAADAHMRLVESIREQGQQVPILVRPHPESPGRYQLAFGHRRLRAIAELGAKIRAIVRNLSDEQLVVAQGQENNERQDLTYIEKARFAQRLQQRFSRETILSSMSLHKGDLSNMLSVVSRIPEDLIDLIGPAPSIGRRNWMDLADQLSNAKAIDKARNLLDTDKMQFLASEERFKALLVALKPRLEKPKADVWSTSAGTRLAKVTHNEAKIELTIDRRQAPEFASFVMERLQALFEDYQARK